MLALPTLLDDSAEAKFLQSLFLAELSGQLLNRLSYISLCYDVRPLDLPAGIPEEGGVCRSLVAHHSMKFVTQPLPAPRRFLLEAEQLLTE